MQTEEELLKELDEPEAKEQLHKRSECGSAASRVSSTPLLATPASPPGLRPDRYAVR